MTAGADVAELTLRWERGRWRAVGAGVDVCDADLGALDGMIVHALRGRGATTAHVRFDTSVLPAWLRQYQAHYFNYVLHIGGGERA
ncbi:MAG TPA: DUF5395 family protein [Gammaproteobacteria bacterium]